MMMSYSPGVILERAPPPSSRPASRGETSTTPRNGHDASVENGITVVQPATVDNSAWRCSESGSCASNAFGRDHTVRPIFAGLSSRYRGDTTCGLYAREDSRSFRHLVVRNSPYESLREIQHIKKAKCAMVALRRGFALLSNASVTLERVNEMAKYQNDLFLAFSTATNKAMSNALSKASEKIIVMFTNLVDCINEFTDKLRHWPDLLSSVQNKGNSIESVLTTGKWANVFTLLKKHMALLSASIIHSLDDLMKSCVKLQVRRLAKLSSEAILSDPDTTLRGMDVGFKLFKSSNTLSKVFKGVEVKLAETSYTDTDPKSGLSNWMTRRPVKKSATQLPHACVEVEAFLSIANEEKAVLLSHDCVAFVAELFSDQSTAASDSGNNTAGDARNATETTAGELKKVRLKKYKRYLLLRWRQERNLFDALSSRLLHSNDAPGVVSGKATARSDQNTSGGDGKTGGGAGPTTPDVNALLASSPDALKQLLMRNGISASAADIARQLRLLQSSATPTASAQHHPRKGHYSERTVAVDNATLVDVLSSNLWRDGIPLYCRTIDVLWCPAISSAHNGLTPPTHNEATIDDVLHFTKLVFRSLALNFQKDDCEHDATTALLVNASVAQTSSMYSDWEEALYDSMVMATNDKCRLTSESKKESKTRTMCKYITCFGLLRKLPTSSGSNMSLSTVSDFSETVSFWRPSLSSQLSIQCQVEAGIGWMRCKMQQFLAAGAWDSYFTVCRHDGKVVQSLVAEFDALLSDCKDIDMSDSTYSKYLTRNLSTVKKQLEYLRDYSQWTHTALVKAIKSRTCNCLEENFPPAKYWRKKSKSTVTYAEASPYVALVATQVLAPVVASLPVLDEGDISETLQVCIGAFIEGWMAYILKKEIMFSLSGSLQLRRDVTEFQRWLSEVVSHLSVDVTSAVLNINELTQMHDAVSLLGCQSQRRRGSYTDSEYSGTSSVSTSSNFSQGSEMTSFEEFIREVEVPHKEKWLALRIKGGHSKSKLLCLS